MPVLRNAYARNTVWNVVWKIFNLVSFGSQVLTGFFTLGNKKNPKGGLLADTQGYKNDVGYFDFSLIWNSKSQWFSLHHRK